MIAAPHSQANNCSRTGRLGRAAASAFARAPYSKSGEALIHYVCWGVVSSCACLCALGLSTYRTVPSELYSWFRAFCVCGLTASIYIDLRERDREHVLFQAFIIIVFIFNTSLRKIHCIHHTPHCFFRSAILARRPARPGADAGRTRWA